jgi:PAS domain S-box-containing protein
MNTTIDCREIIAKVGDAIIAADAKGAIRLWNAAAAQMFGYSEEEALGQSLDIIIPERLRKRHWEGYDKTMATGTTRYGNDVLRVPATHRDGRAMSIAFTVAMLFTPAGEVSAIVAVMRDETTRFNEERALKKRLAELEARVSATG